MSNIAHLSSSSGNGPSDENNDARSAASPVQASHASDVNTTAQLGGAEDAWVHPTSLLTMEAASSSVTDSSEPTVNSDIIKINNCFYSLPATPRRYRSPSHAIEGDTPGLAPSAGDSPARRRVSWHEEDRSGRPLSVDLPFFIDDEAWRCNSHQTGPGILPFYLAADDDENMIADDEIQSENARFPQQGLRSSDKDRQQQSLGPGNIDTISRHHGRPITASDPVLAYKLSATLPTSNAQMVHRLIIGNVQLESIVVRRTDVLLFVYEASFFVAATILGLKII